jgi:alpha-L-fucosidase 2
VVHFTGAAGWISQVFYNYYLFTDDVKFLKERALPFMKEAVMFYENFFKVQGDTLYESVPSYSPETSPANFTQNGESLGIARNATVDFAIARELLANLIEGSNIAGMNKSEIPKWKDMLTRIPPYQIADDNTVREYCDSRYQDNPASVSPALFYPVYPGIEITDSNPELKKAFENTAKKKLVTAGQNFTAQHLTRYANIAARLGDGDTALETVTAAVRSMAMNNLIFAETDWRGMGGGKVDTWASYTLEPNLAITGAVQEMLVQSDAQTITILPALPGALSKGSVDGLLTRAGVEISEMSWDLKRGQIILKLKSRKSGKINLKLPKGAKRPKALGQEKFDPETSLITGLELPGNKTVAFDIRL